MAIMRWDPFTALARLDSDFDELVRRTWGGSPAGRTAAGYVPAVDMVRDGTDVVITLELPGLAVEDLDIEVTEGRLVVSGERRETTEQTEGEKGRVLVREMRYGAFRREFALPGHVVADDVEATYDQGLLRVRVRNVSRPAPSPTKVSIRGTEATQAVEAGADAAGVEG